MPSLKDLAKECGVSVATVSKALNDQPDIAPATRERIRAAARRMGYLPGAAARNVARNMWQYHLLSFLGAVCAGVAGLLTSYYMGPSAGASITLYLAAWFLVTFLLRKKN